MGRGGSALPHGLRQRRVPLRRGSSSSDGHEARGSSRKGFPKGTEEEMKEGEAGQDERVQRPEEQRRR